MSTPTPFTSKLFENSSTNDGWDEWDWVDNNNTSNVSKSQQQSQTTQQCVQIGFLGQNLQMQTFDSRSNPLRSIESTPLPTLDNAPSSFSSGERSLATLSNNNHLNTSLVNNDQVADNNFVQTSSQHIQNSSNVAGIIQHDSQENLLPHVLVGTPPIECVPGESNPQNLQLSPMLEISMAKILDTQVQNPTCDATTSDATNEPESPALTTMFNNNVVECDKVKPLSSLNLSKFVNNNPFKRVGSYAHRTSPVLNTPFLDIIHTTAEISRNEYLQTGQLSVDNKTSINTSIVNSEPIHFSATDNDTFESEIMPPPFESRFVLGENQSKINMEREGDGASSQDNVALPVLQTPSNVVNSITRNSSHLSTSHKVVSHSCETQNTESFEPISETDRQLVAREDIDNTNVSAQIISNVNIQRVVTGLENVEKQDTSLPMQQLREIDLEGAEDQQQNQQHQQQHEQQQTQTQSQAAQSVQSQITQQIPQLHPVKQVGLHAVHQGDVKYTNSVENYHAENLDISDIYNRNIQINPPTKFDEFEFDSDDTDLGKTYSNRNKRIERRKKRDDFFCDDENVIHNHSIRGKRRPKEIDRYSEKERDHRGGSVDIDDSRVYRRPPSRDEEDRYEGRYR